MNVNLKLLHTFLLVAEHSSFCRAARESNRSQSAVSMQVRQLELQLGVCLFHRTTRHVELTREGAMLLDCARKALGELQTGLDQIKERIERQRDRLALACVPSLATTRLPQTLQAFRKIFPAAAIHVRELSAQEMLESIRKQEVDFGIGPRMANAMEFHFQHILDDDICAVLPAQMVAAGQDTIALKDLSRMPTLMLGGSSALQAMLEKAQKSAGVTLDTKYEVRQVQTQIAMAAAGLGAAILPRIAIPGDLDPKLRVLPVVDPPLARELGVVSFRGQPFSAFGTRFIELLQRLLAEPDAAATRPVEASRKRPHLVLAPTHAAV